MGEQDVPVIDVEVRDVDGHRVGLVQRGSGPSLVLLHGIGRNHADWNRALPLLAEAHRVVALDVEGFGESEPWGDRVTLRSMAAMVRRTLDVLAVPRPWHLVGNSMGGAVAMRVAADEPESVGALVLLGSAGFGKDATPGLRFMTVPVLGDVMQRFGATAARLQVRSLVVDPALATRELIAESRERMRRPGAIRTYLGVLRDLGGWNGVHPEWREEVLREVAAAGIPTLVLWGERDGVIPAAHIESVADALPHATTRLLPDLAHAPQLEAPDLVAELVTAFVADAVGSDRAADGGSSGATRAPGTTPSTG